MDKRYGVCKRCKRFGELYPHKPVSLCTVCYRAKENERVRAYRERVRDDPQHIERRREVSRSSGKAYRDRIATDPEKYAAFRERENQRAKEYRKGNTAYRERENQRARTRRLKDDYGTYRERETIRVRKWRVAAPPDYRVKEKVRMQERKKALRSRPGELTMQAWKDICSKYGNKCLACGKPGDYRTLTIDHVVPVKCGGSNDPANIQPLCKRCNSIKGAKVIDYRQ